MLFLVEPAEAPGGAFRPAPVEQSAAKAELPGGDLLLQAQREAAGMEVVGGVGEVVDEQGMREGVAKSVLQGGLPVGYAEERPGDRRHGRRRPARILPRVGLRRALRDAVRAAGRGLQLPQDGLDVRPFGAGQPRRQAFFLPIDATASPVVSRACSRASRL